HRNAPLQGPGHFRVALIDGAGHHQHVGLLDVLGLMTDEHLGTEAFQALGDGGRPDIRTGHFIPEVEQHLGDAAHAHSPDADEMDAADAAHAPYFGLGGGGRLSHGPPPGRYPPPRGWHSAWPTPGRHGPWPRVVAVASAPR